MKRSIAFFSLLFALAVHADEIESTVAAFAKIGSAVAPTFSPDGKRIAFLSGISGSPQVWIVSRDGGSMRATSHVGLALRGSDGALHLMHASSPRNYGRVVIDTRLSSYLYRYGSDTGILVARPVR